MGSILIEQYSTPPSSLLSRSNSISHSRYFNRGIDKIEIVDKSSLRVEKTINFRYLCQGYECFTIRKKGEGIKTSRKNITRRRKKNIKYSTVCGNPFHTRYRRQGDSHF